MSVTETQVIQTLTQSPSRTTTVSYLLGNGMETDEKRGKIMSLDTKLGESMKPSNNMQGKIPRTAFFKSCSLSSISGWLLRTLSYFHNVHSAIASFAYNMREKLQKKTVYILPFCLYLGLLFLVVDGVVIFALLAQSLLPLGMWFLLICTSAMGGIFYITASITEQDSPQKKVHTQ